MRRYWIALSALAAVAAGAVFFTQRGASAPGQPAGDPAKPADLKPAVALPVT